MNWSLPQDQWMWFLQAINVDALYRLAEAPQTVVRIVDEGVNSGHTDLALAYRADRDRDLADDPADQSATPDEADHVHGTQVAGVMVAAPGSDNSTMGLAPLGQVTASYLRYETTTVRDLTGLFRDFETDPVVNNSWGFTSAFADDRGAAGFGELFDTLDDAVTHGRAGLGTSVVFSAGNARVEVDGTNLGQDVNFHNLTNDRGTIAVGAYGPDGAPASFSTPGDAVLTSAPGVAMLTSTGALGTTSDTALVSGTSFSAPLVSSTVAMMLDANPALGYRDVQEILIAASAPDAADVDVTNAAATFNGGGYLFDKQLGFGRLDAAAAVHLAKHWDAQSTRANEVSAGSALTARTSTPDSTVLTGEIADLPAGGIRVEWVEVSLNLFDVDLAGRSLAVTAPSGTTSVLFDNMAAAGDLRHLDFTFTSAAFRGEHAAGRWEVEIGADGSNATPVIYEARIDAYGAPADGRDDTYFFTDAYSDLVAADGARATVSDALGENTLNFAGTGQAVNVRLDQGMGSVGADPLYLNGTFSKVVGGYNADVLAGRDSDDALLGGSGDDMLLGGSGADRLDGGTGIDTASYAGSSRGVDVRIYSNAARGGDAAGDTLAGIENLIGSSHGDVLVGSGWANRLDGGAGNDFLVAGRGDDTVIGGAGDDTLRGHGGADILEGGAGADLLDGDAGSDTASYAGSSQAVDVRIYNNAARGGDAAGDTLSGIENLIGSAHGDVLVGSGGANRLDGGAGDDFLVAGRGDDTLIGGTGDDVLRGHGGADVLDGGDGADSLAGGAGIDTLRGQDGADTLEGGAGADVLDGGDGLDTASYAGSSSGVDVRIYNNAARGGDGAGDTLAGIENLIGSAHGDVLVGSAGANTLDGGDGNDFLVAGRGDDTLIGGAGDDALRGMNGADVFVFAAGGGRDVITDWQDGSDQLDLSAFGFADFQAVSDNATEDQDDVVVDLGNGDQVTLTGLALNNFDNSDVLL